MSPEAEIEKMHVRAVSRGLVTASRGPLPGRAVLLTDDGVPIEAAHLPVAPSAVPGERRDEVAGGAGLAIVVAHGFTGALGRPAVQRAARVFAEFGGVVTFSFRGHGRSGGRSTVGDREVLDLDAAVRWARSLGYRRVATVGFSMGGSVVLRHAGTEREGTRGIGARVAAGAADAGAAPRTGKGPWPAARKHEEAHVAAVVSVSAPARWYYRGTAPMRRLHWVVTRPGGRLVSRIALGTRVHPREWDRVPLPPVRAVADIRCPLLVVHGDRDAYFPLDHPRSLAAAAGDSCELWVERGFGHAENAAGPALLRRIGGWLVERTR